MRTTHFTGYLSDAGFELGRAISGNRESLKKVSFCYIVMGLYFLDMRHEVYNMKKSRKKSDRNNFERFCFCHFYVRIKE